MCTDKAIAELREWACAAQDGNGDRAKEHLQTFRHIAASLIASQEFQQRCESLFGHGFEPADADCVRKFLDAVANVEVHQVEAYGPAAS